jgi:cupin fold WbuC family metalloprotein
MSLAPLRRINDEVFVAADDIVRLDRSEIDFIGRQALANPRGRARICAHKNNADRLHEMLIGIAAHSYVRPHLHRDKVESFHLVEGEADVVVLADDGEISEVVPLGGAANFFYRLDQPRFHTLLLRSPVLVIHETTNGPFDPAATVWAEFAPAEGTAESQTYAATLRARVDALRRG